MKKMSVLVILVLLVIGALFIAANDWPAKLRVINNSEEAVVLNLGVPYQYLYVAAGGELTFHIEKDIYDASVWYCGDTQGRTMDLTRNLKLNFTSCFGSPSYLGERSMEKPDFDGGPKRDFQFQY
jgi:hypothetical protein